MKHLTEEQLVLLYYQEDADAADVTAHLEGCASCRQRFDALKELLGAVVVDAVPEPDEGFEARMWERLNPRLKPKRRFAWRDVFQPRRLTALGTITALLVVAFLAGRFWPRPQRPTEQPISQAARERIMLVAVGDHLDRSQMVLLELLNAPSDGKINISAEQQRAEDLVESNRLYRQTALKAGDVGVANVLDELERTLLQIAHSPSTLTARQLQDLRTRIENQGILFKVRIIDSQVQHREQEFSRQAIQNQT